MKFQMKTMIASLLIAAVAGCVSVPEVDNSPVPWDAIGALSDPKKMEERYKEFMPRHLSPSGKLVPDFDVYNRMKNIRLPSVLFRSSANLMDAILYFQMASVPLDGSGEVILFGMCPAKDGETYPTLPEFKADNISMHDALALVVGSVGFGFYIRGDGVVVIEPKRLNCDSSWLPHKSEWSLTSMP